MKEIFDALDQADPWAILAAAAFLLWLLTEVELRLERQHSERLARTIVDLRWHRNTLIHERDDRRR